MATRGQINSNFYQIVDVDSNGNPTQVKPEYINISNVANSNHANVADVANSVAVANVVGLGNIATINLDGSSSNVLYGNGVWAPQTGTGNGVPGGSNTQVQFNDNGSFGGSANLTFNKTSNTLTASNIAGRIITGSQPDITSLGTLTGLSISGTVTGELVPSSNLAYSLGNTTSRWNDLYLSGNSIYLGDATITANGTTVQLPAANITGDIVTQANANVGQNLNVTGDTFITGNITVSGNTNYTNVNNLYVTDPLIELGGGPNGSPLVANDGLDRGEILHYYTTQPVDAFIGWVNGSGQFAMASNVTNTNNVITINTLGNLRIDTLLGNISGSNVVGAVANATHATVSDSANSVAGANVTGYVANASHATVSDSANSVAVANVSGIGNIATINLDGSSSNVLYGNGVWAGISATNANYANYAGNVTIAAQPNITSLGNLTSLSFDNTVTPITPNVGQMFWDTSEHTVSLGMENGVTQQIGLENYVYVKASSAITDGQVVMFTGAAGDNILAAPADASSVGFKPDYIVGIATQSIATNGFGYITVFGKVHGLNTLAYTVGDILWYDPTSTTGGLTNVQPTDPACQVQMAAVTKVSGGDGHLQVRVTPLTSLTNLTDVKITTPLNGQTLSYDSANLIWINANASSGGTPGGSNTQVQFNDAGSFGGNANLTFDKTTGVLTSSRLVSTVATGTAPFTVTSTTQVANLNVASAGTVTTNAQPNITSLGTLSSVSITGNATVSGNLRTNNIRSTSGDYMIQREGFFGDWQTGGNVIIGGVATTGAVSLGIKGNLNFVDGSNVVEASITNIMDGNLTFSATKLKLGSNSNVMITGGTSGQVLSTDGLGNLSWATGGSGTPGGSNTQVQFNDAGSFGGDADLTFNNVTNTLSVANLTVTATGNIGNLVTTKYNETVVAGGSTGAATITPDVATGTIFNYTLTGNITIDALGNAVAGSGATLILTQDGTGNRTLTSTMKFLGGSKTLSTAAGAIDIMSVFYDGTTYYASLGKGFA